MKKTVIIIICVIVGLIGLYIFGSGFMKESGAFIEDYTVSSDGSELTIKVGVASSIGYIRKVSIHQQESGKLYLDCYSAFGGINGSIGAKNIYTIQLNGDTSMVVLYRNNNYYEAILEKDKFGEWQRVK